MRLVAAASAIAILLVAVPPPATAQDERTGLEDLLGARAGQAEGCSGCSRSRARRWRRCCPASLC